MCNTIRIFAALLFLCVIAPGCGTDAGTTNEVVKPAGLISENTRIVSLNGAITEFLCKAGYEKNIVGVDLTSTYPPSMVALPKAGHMRQIQAEGILSLTPDVVFALEDEIKPELRAQLESAGVELQLIKRGYTTDDTYAFHYDLGKRLNADAAAIAVNDSIKQNLTWVQPFIAVPKVLFIYARGANTLMVAGDDTQMFQFIQLAGAQNSVSGFEDFKPLTPEALVAANPDVILLFDSGAESLKGEAGIWAIPGMTATAAGKNKRVITMNAEYISAFGPRLGKAVAEFNQKLHAWFE